jgi:hypothetical protein
MPEAPAYRDTASITEMQIDDRRRKVGMYSGKETRFNIAGRDHACAGRAQGTVELDSDERFILDKKNEPSGQRTIQH